MSSDGRYDAVVIGAGPGGEVCAARLGDAGKRVAIIERERVGGECAFWACVPSKALLRSEEPFNESRKVPGSRAATSGKPSFAQAAAWRTSSVDDYDDTPHTPFLKDHHVDLIRGDARIESRGAVRVGDRLLQCDEIVIATGSQPTAPPIDGLDLERSWTPREATAAGEVPKRFAILGGGAVGAEMGQAFARYGSHVTIVEAAEQILPYEEPEIARRLERALKSDGVAIETGAKATAVRWNNGVVSLELEGRKRVEADRLLVAAGRKPALGVAELKALGIHLKKGKPTIDERCRAAPGIHIIGDASGVAMFTHVAKYQGRIAADDILGKAVHARYDAVPRCLFTDPEVASVGTAAKQASERGVDCASAVAELKSVARGNLFYETPVDGAIVLVADKRTKTLIGASIVGPMAAEMIGFASLAIRAAAPLDALRDVIQPFPTFCESFFEALSQLGA